MVAVELVDVDGLVRFPPFTLKHAPVLLPGMRVAFGESAWEVVSCVAHEAEDAASSCAWCACRGRRRPGA